MSDSDQSSEPDNTPTPDGMEKRVRRVRRKRKIDKPKAEVKSLLDQGKELLEKMQKPEEGESYGHVGVAEQMRRLQSDDEDDRPLDEVWGTKKRSTSWLWVSLLGIILPLVVVGLGLKHFNDAKEIDQGDQENDFIQVEKVKDTITEEGSLAWFTVDSVNYLTKAREIISLLDTARSPDEFAEFVRPSPYRKKNPLVAGHWDSPALVGNINQITWQALEIASPEGEKDTSRGVIAVSGRRQDQSNFTAYFVKEGLDFQLDWDATTGWSEMSLSDLRSYRPREKKEIRCLIDKKARFDQKFGDVDHSGFLLTEPETGNFIFAFVPLNSDKKRELNHQLKEVLQYGRFVMHLKHDEPVVLEVKAVGKDRFEIVGFKHEGWVNPESSLEAPSASLR